MKTCSVLFAAVISLAGCAQEVIANEAGDMSDVGAIEVALTGVDAELQEYRLRAATFDITGTRYTDGQDVSLSVSSESDLDNPVLTTRLFYGNYSVTLHSEDWYLERITDDGAERVEQALLLSPAMQYATVYQGGVSRMTFQFGVDGELIDFYGGDLEIGIGVQRAPGTGNAN
jgi:hypothetical protein